MFWAMSTEVQTMVLLLPLSAMEVFVYTRLQCICHNNGEDGWDTNKQSEVLFVLVAVETLPMERTWIFFYYSGSSVHESHFLVSRRQQQSDA